MNSVGAPLVVKPGNLLDLLRAGHTDFVLNDTAFDYMRSHALPAMLIASLAAQPAKAPNRPVGRHGLTGSGSSD